MQTVIDALLAKQKAAAAAAAESVPTAR